MSAAPFTIRSADDVLWWAEWIAQTILAFGGKPSTAFHCAAHFADGLEAGIRDADWRLLA